MRFVASIKRFCHTPACRLKNRNKNKTLIVTLLFAVSTLSACSGGGGSDSEPAPSPPVKPIPDATAPVITLNGSAIINHNIADIYTDEGAVATDAVDGAVNVTVIGAVNINVEGSYTLTFSATDTAGNQAASITRTIIVSDLVGPVIALNGDAIIYHNFGDAYTDLGATAVDNIDGTVAVTTTGTVNPNVEGRYTLTYNASDDAAGNQAISVTRTVVIDITAPVLTLNGDAIINHNFGDVYTDLGVVAEDDLDSAVNITVTGTVNINAEGGYTLTYSGTDASGNLAASITRTVNVLDLAGPVITLNGHATINHPVGEIYTDLGATADDNVDGLVNVTLTGDVNSDQLGSYTLTYTSIDNIGHTSIATRTIHVVNRPFISTWKTDNDGGSDDNQIIITTNSENFIYNYSVDWGDGSALEENITGDATHTYDTIGTYTVTINGDFPQPYFTGNTNDSNKLLSVELWGDIEWSSMTRAFYSCENLVVNATDNPLLYKLTDMSIMFSRASSFNQDISAWDVSSVKFMKHMFKGATSFNQDISAWDVSSVASTLVMFSGATAFNQDISAWDVSSVKEMDWMFHDATSFNQDISAWDVSSVKEMDHMFDGATSFNQDISAWDVSSVTSMRLMFSGVILSVENYDALLNSWSQQSVQYGVDFHAGDSYYSKDSQAARDILTNNYGWTITDLGINADAPILTLNGGNDVGIDIHHIGDSYSDLGIDVVTVDNVGGNVSVTTSGYIDVNIAGDYIITYVATDAEGNQSTIRRTVRVADLSNIALIGGEIVEVGIDRIYQEQGAIIYDAFDNLTAVALPTGFVDATTIGQYTLTYNATNRHGESVSAVRTVNVVAPRPFISTWKTNGTGVSDDNQITITTNSENYAYDYNINWGDGSQPDDNVAGDITHTYDTHGTYTITISGDFPQTYFPGGRWDQASDNKKLLSIEQWGDIKWQSANRAFYYAENLVINSDADDYPDLRLVTDASEMFYSAKKFNGDSRYWQVGAISDMRWMFYEASSFNKGVSSWDVSAVTSMTSMFGRATAFNQDISAWDVSSVTSMFGMFSGAAGFDQDISAWDVSTVNLMGYMFDGASSFNQDISAWDVSTVFDMSHMFSKAKIFNQDISRWNVSAVTNMSWMFRETAFNQDISGWDVSAVTDMNGMFLLSNVFNQNINAWNVSSVTSMNSIFGKATAFNQDISAWNVSSVTSMTGMFSGAISFNQNISDWDVSSVTNISGMFNGASAFNQDIGGWDVSSVSNMNQMFLKATAFNQDISAWNVSAVTNTGSMFSGVALDTVFYDALLNNWSRRSVKNGLNFHAGDSYYSLSSQAARDVLTNTYGWTITDLGINANAPIITLNGNNESGLVNHQVGDSYSDLGANAVAVDSIGGNVSITSTGSIDVNTMGDYIITYIAIDSQGNQSTISRTVRVANLSGITLSGGETVEVGIDRIYQEQGATIYDAFGDVIEVEPPSGFVDVSTVGEYLLTYSATNQHGDRVSVVRTVNVVSPRPFITRWKTDNTGGSDDNQITITTNSSYAYDYSIHWGDGQSDDNVAGDITHTYSTSGTYTVTISGDFPQTYFIGTNSDAKKLLSIEQWGDIKWQSANQAFYYAENLVINTSADDYPDLRLVSDTTGMFFNAKKFNGDTRYWQVSAVMSMSHMFYGATAFNQDISVWNVSLVRSMNNMFFEASSFNQDISAWDVSSVTSMTQMFNEASSFNQDISAWNVGAVTSMDKMFYKANSFNQDISGWDVGAVTDMSWMFYNVTAFNQDISGWNVGAVTDMSWMFALAKSFNQDIGAWNVSSVATMRGMFYNADAFNQDISGWDVSAVNDMDGMFRYTDAFNQDISTWDVGAVTDMDSMFGNADAFNQDISAWDISSVRTMDSMYYSAALSTEHYDALLNSWSQQVIQNEVKFHAGYTRYSSSSQAARNILTNAYGWDITDGGVVR